jgi:multidrug efflux pump
VSSIPSIRAPVRPGTRGTSDIIGTIQLQFVDWSRRRPAAQILQEVRERTADIAGIVVNARVPRAGPTNDKPIVIELSSRFPEQPRSGGDQVRELLESVDGLQDIVRQPPAAGHRVATDVDRTEAARLRRGRDAGR